MSAPENDREDDQLLRYYNDADIALNELYQAARTSSGAREVLRRVADDLVKCAGDWSQVACLKK